MVWRHIWVRKVCLFHVAQRDIQKQGRCRRHRYYVEQGGKGFDRIMEHFGIIYRDDRLRASRSMAAYGPVDRRILLPVHLSDLVAHEVITNRHESPALKILGELVVIDDINERDDLQELIDQWTKDHFAMNKLREASRRRKSGIN
jgi:hypothetical protein